MFVFYNSRCTLQRDCLIIMSRYWNFQISTFSYCYFGHVIFRLLRPCPLIPTYGPWPVPYHPPSHLAPSPRPQPPLLHAPLLV